ncbi:sugar ABC transporter permease [Eisenbergiella tayi]|uniref:carbohydrate ABC transporter permease n=1 Tax=Eisenbergiella tayi TaxID=1432052 RepID=UPI0008FD786D|nr:carbohydrate ABC transporter permease [Eisenbergiella tayi]OIZ64717.1 sugar ABC transporter permease [Eisenbergiella tayi]
MVESKSVGKTVFSVCNAILLTTISVICILPIIHVIMSSFSEPEALALSKGLVLWPRKFSLIGYREVLKSYTVWNGYLHTLIYVSVQTLLGVLFTSIGAYVLSRKNLKLKNPVMLLITFTMMFNGGLIPNYILMNNLHMLDTIWAIIIPGCITPMNLIIMRTFFLSIPDSLEESAKLDGAGAWTILFRIYYPLSKASLAVIALFLIVAQWNSYFIAMIYLQDRDLWPLQLVLKDLITSQQGAAMLAAGDSASSAATLLLTRVVKYAVIVVGTLPIFCIYPFVQKYFVKGVMIGSIKG